MNEGDRNILLNVLNVLCRISDKQFILNEWKLGNTANTSIIINCLEAINIIEDYSLFDLLENDYGVWNNMLTYISFETKFYLTEVVKKIYVFEEFNKSGKELLLDKDWIEIMKIASKAANSLKADLLVVDDNEFLL